MSVSYITGNFNFNVYGDKTKVQQYFALFMHSVWIIEKDVWIESTLLETWTQLL